MGSPNLSLVHAFLRRAAYGLVASIALVSCSDGTPNAGQEDALTYRDEIAVSTVPPVAMPDIDPVQQEILSDGVVTDAEMERAGCR